MKPNEIYCGTCNFWVSLKDLNISDDESVGECRRNPPQLSVRLTEQIAKFLGDKVVIPGGWFPAVADDSWCGEWQERCKKEEEEYDE